jgi:peptidoglycan/LPS O-acetylase OafA/YrhL
MQEKQHLDALTTLRFFAAALIVIGHADPIFGPFNFARSAPLNQGVSFFFVLSGFILTWNYPSLTGWKDRRQFWLARIARIWPLHLATCLLWIGLIFNFDRATHFPGTEGAVKLFTNLLLMQAWVPSNNWVLSKLFVAEGGNRDCGDTRLILPIVNQVE